MNESNAPMIHISGTVSLKDYVTAVRAHGIRHFLKYMVVYLLVIIATMMGFSLYYWYEDLADGYITLGQWFDVVWESVFRPSPGTYAILGILAVYALYLIAIRPVQAQKRLHELHPDGFPVTYDFFDDHLVISSATQVSDQTIRLRYADVKRKIKETGYTITLSTGQRNRIGLYKAVMTAEEAERVRKLLNERCPQRKTKA